MANGLNHDSVLLLEQPIIKVPTDALRSSLRSHQRALEGGLAPLKNSLADLYKKAGQWEAVSGIGGEAVAAKGKAEALKTVEAMLSKAKGVKRKLKEAYEEPKTGTDATIERIRARLDHLQDLHQAETQADDSYKKFSSVRLDRQLVDYMLRSGYTKSGVTLSRATGIEKLVDAPLFAEIERIEAALRRHSCSEALAWCKENQSALKKLGSALEFELRYQEFIELARARHLAEAIAYCRKHLVPWQQTRLKDTQKAMALLAFDVGTSCPPYAALYDTARWDFLLHQFRNTLFALHSIPSQPLLHISIAVGLAALKLPTCYATSPTHHTDAYGGSTDSSDDDEDGAEDEDGEEDVNMMAASIATLPASASKRPTIKTSHPPLSALPSVQNVDCPVCDHSGLGQLAKECPWSHHANSTIVCHLTGKVVAAGDGLAALPNGRVYSVKGLEAMAAKDESGLVTCPKTGSVFGLESTMRVFIS